MRPDDPQYSALDTLLSLDGEVFRMDNGRDDIAAYEFETAGQLLEDFWRETERVLAERR